MKSDKKENTENRRGRLGQDEPEVTAKRQRTIKPILYALAIIVLLALANLAFSSIANKEDEAQATNAPLADAPTFAVDFLNAKGYKIEASQGLVSSYTLTKDYLANDGSHAWAYQAVNPDDYLGKEISLYRFIVSNHPLDLELPNDEYDKTVIVLMTSGTEVIGGTSMPDSKEPLAGGPYSLDGKTLEEVTGLSFPEWREKWTQKYGSRKYISE
ncbi:MULTISPECIES: hypothetical protein [Brevibacillus]|jgi:hypothetical protein|uniref:hypothetical protein n=1 Tax=Brevibacillus TaxID=55080 RepID=UPI001D09BD16|nr:hypothetical protein [Brevibacillus borstelensis]MCC0565989.1 hypothetical protein [Brevibacillus borstelensis]MCM3469413.1 hypothetical protein [Brevibacillus borstelensis]MCM3557297.1 hypothetical protein [Brevibacillus borstelensis]MCM3590926.1 hypothetical protein [Brevibacillus borstelensis]MED1745299.1 hypothetical protein [Brevibacillus borstelensis]